MRHADQAPPSHALKDIDPIMDTFTPAKHDSSESRLDEIASVIVVAEAADEFPQHIIQMIIELPHDKRELLKNIVRSWACGVWGSSQSHQLKLVITSS